MNRSHSVSTGIVLLLPSLLAASFSFKKMASYVMPPTQENVVHYEHEFPADGTLEIENIRGAISVKTWDQEKIVIEATKKGPEKELPLVTIEPHFDSHEARLITKQPHKTNTAVTYHLLVPHAATLRIRTLQGPITITQAQGPITATTHAGNIDIDDASNTVLATTHEGAITAKIKTASLRPVTLESHKGSISLWLPHDTAASLQAKAPAGKITCDLYVTLKARTTKLNPQFWDAVKRDIEGVIGTGGPTMSLQALKGDIAILEY